MKIFVQTLLIFAFVTLGVSPACAFINGEKNWIEICSANGDIKRVQVDADSTPLPQDGNHENHHAEQFDCGFCFAFGHMKVMKPEAQAFAKMPASNYLAVTAGTSIPRALKLQAFAARAPPHSLS